MPAIGEHERGVLVSTWCELRTEWTRTLFGVASAGVGLSTGAILTANRPPPVTTSVLLIVAAVAFGVLACICLNAIKRSSDLIEFTLRDESVQEEVANRDLLRMQRWQNGLAGTGFLALGLAALLQIHQGAYMTHRDELANLNVHNHGGLRGVLSARSEHQPTVQPTSNQPADAGQLGGPLPRTTDPAAPASDPAPAAAID